MKKIIYLLVLICSFHFMKAQPIVTDRPDQTESSVTIPKGTVQIESGVVYENFDYDDYQLRRTTIAGSLFRYGVLDRFELRLISSMLVEAIDKKGEGTFKSRGIDNLSTGFKVMVLEEKEKVPGLALIAHVTFPSGSSAFKNDKINFDSRLSLSHPVRNWFSMGYNIGWMYDGQASNGTPFYTISAAIPIGNKAGMFIENYGEWVDVSDFNTSFDTGFTFLLRENLQLDLSMGTGINHRYNFYNAGVSYRFPE